MAKVIAFPTPSPEKFGFKPASKKNPANSKKSGQLDLFSEAKVINLNRLSVFEEAFMLDESGDKKSKELYLKAIDQNDSLADAYCNLGIIESEDKNFIPAIDYFTKSLKEDPRHYEAHYNLANLYTEVGNIQLAKIHYQLSIAIEPDFPNSHFNLGITLATNKEVALAIESLEKYKKLVSPADQSQANELIESLSK